VSLQYNVEKDGKFEQAICGFDMGLATATLKGLKVFTGTATPQGKGTVYGGAVLEGNPLVPKELTHVS
jgi:hypothetical protein